MTVCCPMRRCVCVRCCVVHCVRCLHTTVQLTPQNDPRGAFDTWKSIVNKAYKTAEVWCGTLVVVSPRPHICHPPMCVYKHRKQSTALQCGLKTLHMYMHTMHLTNPTRYLCVGGAVDGASSSRPSSSPSHQPKHSWA